MKEKIKEFTINAVKILCFIIVWLFLFHSCNRYTKPDDEKYQDAYDAGYERGYEDGKDDY